MGGQHTPGPWFINEAAGPRGVWGTKATIGIWAQAKLDAALKSKDPDCEPDDEKWLCGVWGECGPEDVANARLIAAAPDLLAALEALRADTNIMDHCPSGLWVQMFDALEKARGEEA